MEEIIRTNQELCKQLAEDDEIISEYKARIKSLERDLEYSLEDKILTLKARIKEITLHQRKMALNTPQPPAPNELIDLYDKVLDNNGHIDDYSNGDTQIWDILSAQNIRSMSRHTAHVEPLISKLLLLDVRMTGFAKYKFAGLLN
ncbi:19672_t:CDS:2 [Entrophospora sp. SA101]|nr:11476_t:CDS:2 [Entrophospora sp. SA101]CAJ0917170.1 19672_t:CDS:2 [Entrophospora sp. SA101]